MERSSKWKTKNAVSRAKDQTNSGSSFLTFYVRYISHWRLQIHDELILELNFDEEHISRMKEIAIKSCCIDCEKFYGLTVPLILDCTCGLSWQSMKPLGGPKG
jgi:hypothetical protein